MVPSAHSSAAPTLNPEYRARACSRAARAAATSASEAANDALEQADELATHPLGDGHDVVVVERRVDDTGGRVRDARDAEHFEAHLPGHDRLGRGRHADRIGAEGAKGPDLGRRFVTR